MKPETLIQRYLDGIATGAEVSDLDRLLAADPGLRRTYIDMAASDAGMREIALERVAQAGAAPEKTVAFPRRPERWLAAAAAVAAGAMVAWTQLSKPPVIATLVSVEDAAWESPLPTAPGSELSPGYLKLTSGIATILFRSGAEVVLEGPAHLVLETPMRSKLLEGSAVVDVPKSAIGFVIATPDGYAVDHGTQFAVNVGSSGSGFEVLEGEISVHLPGTGEEARLFENESASILGDTLQTYEGGLPPRKTPEKVERKFVKVKPEGRATSIISDDDRNRSLGPDMLTVKYIGEGKLERRVLVGFDITKKADIDDVVHAQLGMKMIRSDFGYASRLPRINRFAVYGVVNPEKEAWPVDCLWEQAPGIEDCVLLGKFEVRRSRQDKFCQISGDALLSFLREDADGDVSFLIVRETGQVEGTGTGLVHAFASDSHPEASSPALRLWHERPKKSARDSGR